MKRVIIHVGPRKTGSSAIQLWLNSHRDQLMAKGIFYPAHNIDPNGISVGNATAILRPESPGEKGKPRTRLIICETRIAKILEEFDKTKCHTLLLSSEHFFARIRAIARHIPNAEFLAYIRNPVNLLESTYNQRVKGQGETSKFSLPAEIDFEVIDDIDALLQSDRAPKIYLRPYVEKLFHGGSIVNDFLQFLNINIDAISNSRINPSYTLEALEFKRYCNHLELEHSVSHHLRQLLQAWDKGLSNYSFVKPEDRRVAKELLQKQLNEFLSKYNYPDLEKAIPYLLSDEDTPYTEQRSSFNELKRVSQYIEKRSPATYEILRTALSQSSRDLIPNEDFSKCFDTGCVETSSNQ